MLAVGLDDTDSRDTGTCTTYVGAVLGERLRRAGFDVERRLLVRCNPAVEYKTRGNAAVALHVERPSGPVEGALECDDTDSRPVSSPDADTGTETPTTAAVDAVTAVARETIDEFAATEDPRTNPGLVVAPELDAVAPAVASFARRAVRDHHEIEDAVDLVERLGYRSAAWGNGRGRIGALAAVGAWHATDEWTYEHIAYREPERWGTERSVEADSVVAAADEQYPTVWDTVDRTADEIVCVPHTPGPVLFGIRGDDPAAVVDVANAIDAEPIERATTFVTNQGTDAHVRDVGTDPHVRDVGTAPADAPSSPVDVLRDGRAYRVDGVVVSDPATRPGGHVFLDVDPEADLDANPDAELDADLNADAPGATGDDPSRADARSSGREPESRDSPGQVDDRTLECVAFEPTKRFRDRVRALRKGDVVTVSGELADGTLKLEKFALREPVRTESVTPTCPACDRRMESAGAEQGYRCRDCGTSAGGREERPLDRDLDVGWYEVPPVARRHVAKPLVRGGFDAPTHPER